MGEQLLHRHRLPERLFGRQSGADEATVSSDREQEASRPVSRKSKQSRQLQSRTMIYQALKNRVEQL